MMTSKEEFSVVGGGGVPSMVLLPGWATDGRIFDGVLSGVTAVRTGPLRPEGFSRRLAAFLDRAPQLVERLRHQHHRLAEQRRRASIKGILSSPNPPPVSQLLHAARHLKSTICIYNCVSQAPQLRPRISALIVKLCEFCA